MTRNAYEVPLAGGPVVILAELTPPEVLAAFRGAGANAPDVSCRIEALRHSIRKVGDRDVTYTDLVGTGFTTLIPRSRHQVALSNAWRRIHEPDENLLEQVKASVAIEADGGAERWIVTLPSGSKVALLEQSLETVGSAMAQASGKNASARALGATLEGLRGAVRDIDGKGVTRDDLEGKKWPFSARDTLLLAEIWQEMQVGAAEELEAVGEPRPAGTTK